MKKRLLCFLLAVCFAVFSGPWAAAREELEDWDGLTSPSYNVRVPPEEVRRRCAGGTEYLDKYGVTRKSLVNELNAHLYDNYYLGTPQMGGDWQSPRGDTSYNGAPGMNCAGFVAYVLRKAGMDGDAVTATMKQSPWAVHWGVNRRYEYLSGASNYMSLIEYGHLVAHVYESKNELLWSGMLEKGDLILRFWTDNFEGGFNDNHLMIFWGDSPYEDKVWHSTSGNRIGPIANEPACYIIIKFAPETFAGYTDVRAEDWYAPTVEYVKEKGFMKGVSDTLFDPVGTVTRAQAVQVLYNMAGKPELPPEAEDVPFVDIAEGHWAGPAIAWAYGASVLSGADETHFAPEACLTREQAAQLFKGFWSYMTKDTPKPDGACLDAFPDRDSISPWALEAMGWAVEYGLLSGKGDGRLAPWDLCSRVQLAQMIRNYYEAGAAS